LLVDARVQQGVSGNGVIGVAITIAVIVHTMVFSLLSGWGTTSYQGYGSRILKATNVTITEQDDPTCAAVNFASTFLSFCDLCKPHFFY
jgi:hypothetical protein